MISNTDLAFAAGLMEGEGTVRINKPTRRNRGALIVSCVNTDRWLIDFLHDRWAGSLKTGGVVGQRGVIVWTIASRQALAFLTQIEPYVVSKRMRLRIDTARWWQKIKSKHWRYRIEDDYAEAFACYHWMRELNARGVTARTF
jgi:hypothetical protein